MTYSETGRSTTRTGTSKEPPCPVCAGTTRVCFPEIWDDRYGYSGVFRMNRCGRCGHRHIVTTLEPRHLVRLYSQFYPRSRLSLDDFAPYEESFGVRAWWSGDRGSAFRWVPRNVRVLDIGCGFGQTLAYHRQRGCEVWGVEADENIRRVADRFGFNVHIGVFDSSAYEPDYFDYVTLDQVVEHSLDPKRLLLGIAKVLKPGGVAILSTPNPSGLLARVLGRYWLNWHVPYHLQFFTKRSMRELGATAGLALESTRTATSSEWMLYQWLHLLAYPALGQPSPFWSSQNAERGRLYRLAYQIATRVHRLRVNHVATRILDLLGLGDGRLYMLRKPAG